MENCLPCQHLSSDCKFMGDHGWAAWWTCDHPDNDRRNKPTDVDYQDEPKTPKWCPVKKRKYRNPLTGNH